ncbi:MAG: restriction endonuclease subunit S [Lachnospiraceae bacterium]|nr:restriction endonuclease subunit S [Lachnospiraceae bacterium]
MKYKLEDICIRITDGSHYSPKAVEYGYPMFSVKDMLEYGFSYDNCKRVDEEDFQKLKASGCVPKIGDVLVAKDGSYLKEIFVCREEKEEAVLSSIAIFRPNVERVTSDFLCYLLKSPKVYNYIKNNCVSGSALPRIVLKEFKTVGIDVPDIIIQERITGILRELDEKIILNNSINDNLQEQAQAIYHHMIIENADAAWTPGVLSDIAIITMGQSPKGESYNEEGVGTVFFQGRAEFGFRFPTRRLYTTDPKRMAQANDALMSVRAPVGDMNVAYEDCCIGRGLGAIRSKDGHQSFVLYTMFALREQLNVFNGEGTVFGSINRDALNSMPVDIPPKEIMDQFEDIVSPMDAAIRNNYDEICRLQALRDSLLPRLMSGELDVSDIEL